ncbi:Cupredoxin-like domain-containing protein [Abditibacterium utsteinense]|uniref:Cupredoxin-like domain-containing protein n=1 Tax=Abditibacterium utsteinense TaxID=1960156 RepID=A0A2S8SPH6_9BACT|nr:cupredoxin domain-containing protein [Abditibacterium utsteinense]PQV62700.1 Cupredoxin-like domain-containing protein [Abditibacterium utsteinense]
MKNLRTLTSLALGAALLGASIAPQIAFAHGGKHQDVTVLVDGKGYHPAMVGVKAGKEVHMTFVSKGESCGNNISIPALKQNLSLKVGQSKMIKFTPKKGQTIAFACGMKMFKGKVVAK